MENKQLEKNAETAIKAAYLAGKKIAGIYAQADFEIEIKSDNSPLTIADKAAHEIISEILRGTSIPVISEEGIIPEYEIRKNWKYCWIVDPLDGTKEFIKKNGQFTVNIALVEDGKPVMGVIYAPIMNVMYFSIGNQAFILEKTETNQDPDIFWQFLTKEKKRLPLNIEKNNYIVLASSSHQDAETTSYIDKLRSTHQNIGINNIGSSLKFCMIAAGKADIYPRFICIKEWDTAAGQAIVEAAGGNVTDATSGLPMKYNKESLINPWFIAKLD